MAKFAMIISKCSDLKAVKAFQKNYSEKNIKKNFKCKEATVFDRNVNSWEDLEKNFKIKERTFEKLSWHLLFADKDALIDCEYVNYSTRKFFIFSDDVMQSMFSSEFFSDDVYVAAFELDQDSAEELAEKLDDFSSVEHRVEQLNEAQDLYSSLSSIAEDCHLNIFYRSAEDEISEALSDAEQDFENLKSDIQGIINSSWNSEVMI